GYDIEAKTLDIDLLEIGIPRSRQVRVKEFVRFLEKLLDEVGEITYSDLLKEASDKGFEKDLVLETLRKLKKDGIIYEPRPGVISKT
ncbi:MAG: hypothetical protein B6U89_06690, partial [Desulfurococcales archaeon ex4484_58]